MMTLVTILSQNSQFESSWFEIFKRL